MFVYKPKVINIRDLEGIKPINTMELLIVQEFKDGTWIPSRLTDYIKSVHANASINTKMKSARIICGFINYIINQINKGEDSDFSYLKETGLYGVKHIHLAKYINHLSNRNEKANSYETVKSKEAILVNFYSFLYKRGITDKDAKIEEKIAPVTQSYSNNGNKKRGKRVTISPLDDKSKYRIKYPSKNVGKKTVLKDMDTDVWEQLIEYAEEEAPHIALGVAFQCMGGLRQGEVVNLMLSSVDLRKDENHILLDIKDRPYLFAGRKINPLKSSVKKPRDNQPVFNFNGELFNLWDKHLKLISQRTNVKNKEALFLDSRGQAMSGDVYEREFKKLKKGFIDKVGMSSVVLEEKLKKYKWGSHIGRHVFSNHLIKGGYVESSTGAVNTKYLMVVRGDDSEKSVNDYIDTRAVVKGVTKNINIISDIAAKTTGNKE